MIRQLSLLLILIILFSVFSFAQISCDIYSTPISESGNVAVSVYSSQGDIEYYDIWHTENDNCGNSNVLLPGDASSLRYQVFSSEPEDDTIYRLCAHIMTENDSAFCDTALSYQVEEPEPVYDDIDYDAVPESYNSSENIADIEGYDSLCDADLPDDTYVTQVKPTSCPSGEQLNIIGYCRPSDYSSLTNWYWTCGVPEEEVRQEEETPDDSFYPTEPEDAKAEENSQPSWWMPILLSTGLAALLPKLLNRGGGSEEVGGATQLNPGQAEELNKAKQTGDRCADLQNIKPEEIESFMNKKLCGWDEDEVSEKFSCGDLKGENNNQLGYQCCINVYGQPSVEEDKDNLLQNVGGNICSVKKLCVENKVRFEKEFEKFKEECVKAKSSCPPSCSLISELNTNCEAALQTCNLIELKSIINKFYGDQKSNGGERISRIETVKLVNDFLSATKLGDKAFVQAIPKEELGSWLNQLENVEGISFLTKEQAQYIQGDSVLKNKFENVIAERIVSLNQDNKIKNNDKVQTLNKIMNNKYLSFGDTSGKALVGLYTDLGGKGTFPQPSSSYNRLDDLANRGIDSVISRRGASGTKEPLITPVRGEEGDEGKEIREEVKDNLEANKGGQVVSPVRSKDEMGWAEHAFISFLG